MEHVMNRITNLLTVKSLVTLVLTAIFSCLALNGEVSRDFMTIYAVIIAFYFGTQSKKPQNGQAGEVE